MTSLRYAIVDIMGRQEWVTVGQTVRTNLCAQNPGENVVFDKVYCVTAEGQPTQWGSPLIPAKVKATVLEHKRDKKILVFKFLKKNRSKKMMGHRQGYTNLRIESIEV